MNTIRSVISLLLITSCAWAHDVPALEKRSSGDDQLEHAIRTADVESVRAMLQQGGVDVNKGLGIDKQPALVLAVHELALSLKERAKDYTWHAVAALGSIVALGGLYGLLHNKKDKIINTAHTTQIVVGPAETGNSTVENESRKDEPGNRDTGAGIAGSESEATESEAPVGRGEQEIPGATTVPIPKEHKHETTKKVRSKSVFKRFKHMASTAVGGTTAALSLKRARQEEASKTVITPEVERRIEIVRLLARHKDVDIFACDAQGKSAVDIVITCMAGYGEGSECYACMEEVKDALATRIARSLEECLCIDCACVDCQCSGGECLCSDCPSERPVCAAAEECVCEICECTPGQECIEQ